MESGPCCRSRAVLGVICLPALITCAQAPVSEGGQQRLGLISGTILQYALQPPDSCTNRPTSAPDDPIFDVGARSAPCLTLLAVAPLLTAATLMMLQYSAVDGAWFLKGPSHPSRCAC